MRTLTEIIVHAAVTPPNWRAGQSTAERVAEVRRWHVEDNGWSDIGYHYMIDRDGTVAIGRPLERPGAHVRGHNRTTVGICLFGGYQGTASDEFSDNFTPEQDIALRDLIERLETEYPSITKVSGHNEYAAKACPCFNVKRWLKKKSQKKSVAQSKTVQASALTALSGAGAGAAEFFGVLGDDNQMLVLILMGVVVLAALFIMRDRVKKWARGIK